MLQQIPVLKHSNYCAQYITGPEEAVFEWSGQFLVCLQVYMQLKVIVCKAHSAVRKHKHAREVWGYAPQENFEKLDT